MSVMRSCRTVLPVAVLAACLASGGMLSAEGAFSKAIAGGEQSVVRISGTLQSLLGGRRTGAIASGVIVSADGYIVTEGLSLRTARDIKITLPDGEELPATVVKTDTVNHLKLLKVDRKDLKPLPFAAGGPPEVGHWLVVVGNPFGLARTRSDALSISVGVVSALRPVEGQNIKYTRPVIITDVTINPGAPGGAVLDLDGKLVGICGPLLTSPRTNTQLSFAVPVDAVREIMEAVKPEPGGTAETPEAPPRGGYLGAYILDESKGTRGAFIQEVVPDSPADRAGLRAADLVTAVNGVVTPNGRRLIEQIDKLDAGAVAQMNVTRGATPLTLSITLGTPPRPVLK